MSDRMARSKVLNMSIYDYHNQQVSELAAVRSIIILNIQSVHKLVLFSIAPINLEFLIQFFCKINYCFVVVILVFQGHLTYFIRLTTSLEPVPNLTLQLYVTVFQCCKSQ